MNDIFKVYDFENEQQWLKGRMNGIGGSDASAVVGMNPYKSNIDLFEEKIGRVMPKDISDKPCVIYGKNAEEYIRERLQILFVHNASVTLIFLTELSEKVHMKKCFRGKSA